MVLINHENYYERSIIVFKLIPRLTLYCLLKVPVPQLQEYCWDIVPALHNGHVIISSNEKI
jgi:hypothetical protein